MGEKHGRKIQARTSEQEKSDKTYKQKGTEKSKMTVLFDSGEIVYHRTWANFIKGKVGKKSRQTKKELAA